MFLFRVKFYELNKSVNFIYSFYSKEDFTSKRDDRMQLKELGKCLT